MSHAFSSDGTKIEYGISGTGPLLVLVDGALCWRAFGPAASFVQVLGDQYSVVTYDRRGRGGSTDTSPYAVDREVEDLEAVVRALGAPVFLFGQSSGAILALHAAQRLGSLVKRLAVFEAPIVADSTRAPIDVQSDMESLVAKDNRNGAVRLFLRTAGAPGPVIAIMSILPLWRQLKAVAHTLPYDLAITAPFQKGTVPPPWTVSSPCLFSVGGSSPVWMKNGQQFLVQSLPGSKFIVLPGQTHNLQAKAMAPVLLDFFR